ncbi:MAG: metallophosphoesterase [Deltaproteobacteria bacterium]|nr:metallophosphoesterase [Deltaproteobacteria bacterium]
MTNARIAAAREVARGKGGGARARPAESARTLAIGDPQAPFGSFLEILDLHGALGDDGWLVPEVSLISMGDHFDWGAPQDRAAAAEDGELLLRWLAAHDPEQVTILIGNHDLARVGELWDVSDDGFAAAQRLADQAYRQGDDLEAAFKRAWPRFFSAELVARDLSTFRTSQRTLVEELLRAGRFRAAHAHGGALFVHAGVTRHELLQLGLEERASAEQIAAALDAALAAGASALGSGPLALGALHQPGDGAHEGRGMFYHRPTLGEGDDAGRLGGERPWRRFHPDQLPRGLTQVVGHVRDDKCRAELRGWCAPTLHHQVARDGPVRHLVVEGGRGRYAHGVPPSSTSDAAVVIFVDNGMGKIGALADYQLLDAGTRLVARRAR